MKVYACGGFVRDLYLKKIGRDIPHASHDKDFVVVGATISEMIALGYKQVGKRFPVFIHPKNGAEYALARTEIKTGTKHADFQFSSGPDITLAEDSLRRDLTINALFLDEDTGEIFDPTNRGFIDARDKIIRHVSEHFGEDPLRVLRACRFAAQFPGFVIAPETMTLMQSMTADGMLENLTRERVDNEFLRAMSPGYDSSKFLDAMRECGALAALYPELFALCETLENQKYHTSATTFGHILCALDCALDESRDVKIAIAYHDIYKATSYAKMRESMAAGDKRRYCPHDDEIAEEYLAKYLADRKFPKATADLCRLSLRQHMRLWALFSGMDIGKWIDTIGDITHGFKHDSRHHLTDLLKVCRADNASDKACEASDYAALEQCAIETFDACAAVGAGDIPWFENLPIPKRLAVLKRARKQSVRKSVAFFSLQKIHKHL